MVTQPNQDSMTGERAALASTFGAPKAARNRPKTNPQTYRTKVRLGLIGLGAQGPPRHLISRLRGKKRTKSNRHSRHKNKARASPARRPDSQRGPPVTHLSGGRRRDDGALLVRPRVASVAAMSATRRRRPCRDRGRAAAACGRRTATATPTRRWATRSRSPTRRARSATRRLF